MVTMKPDKELEIMDKKNVAGKSEAKRIMEEPIALIETKDTKFCLNPKATEILASISKPLVVVAIAGLYRTGKSYLLNRLAGKSKGFALGATIQSMTKGIWMWAIAHPLDDKKCLLLIDTEGLGDAEKGDQTHDATIFALAILLSSILVYNSKDNIDQDALDKLHFVTNLSDHISIDKENANKSMELDRFLPAFAWALRDFSLLLEIDGRPVTADEYLEHCLKLRDDKMKCAEKFNEIRFKIRNYFKERKCFVFSRPVFKARQLQQLGELSDNQLDEDFVAETASFCNYIFRNSKIKHLDNGEKINGSMLLGLLENYVKAINSGAVPCIQDAVETMSKVENEKAVNVAFQDYKEKVAENLKMPTTVAVASEIFSAANQAAIKTFIERSVLDKEHKYQRMLGDLILEENDRLLKENEETSTKKCRELLKKLSQTIEEKMESGAYSVPSGFMIYQKDMENLKSLYEKTPDKGIMEGATFIEFLNEKTNERNTVMKVDEQMTENMAKLEKEKHLAEMEKVRAEHADERRQDAEKITQEKEKMYEQNIQEIRAKHKEALDRMEEKQEELLKSREMEERRLREEGRQTEDLRKQIAALKAELANTRQKPGGCFSAWSKVQVQTADSVLTKQLKDLQIGDVIETYNAKTGEIAYEPVYYIAHAESTMEFDLIELCTENNKIIRMDENHLVYSTSKNDDVDGGSKEPPLEPKRTGSVQIGDYLWIRQDGGRNLRKERVIGRSVVPNMMVRHPLTLNHTIIVDDILASVHMFHEHLLRAVTAPLRFLYRNRPSALASPVVTKLVEFWDRVELFF